MADNAPAATALSGSEHFLFKVDDAFRVTLSVDWVIVLLLVALALLIAVLRQGGPGALLGSLKHFDIDEAQLGLGDQSITLRPNDIDRQIAYKIWVELSTRKIGLEVDLEHDVLAEVYDSWHTFFHRDARAD